MTSNKYEVKVWLTVEAESKVGALKIVADLLDKVPILANLLDLPSVDWAIYDSVEAGVFEIPAVREP